MKKQNILSGLVLVVSLFGATQAYSQGTTPCSANVNTNDSSCISGLTANNVPNSTAVRNSEGKSTSTYQDNSAVAPFNKPVNVAALACNYPHSSWPDLFGSPTPGKIPDGEWILAWSSPVGYFTYSSDRSGNLTSTTWGVQCKADWRRCEEGTLSPIDTYIYPECNLEPVNGSCGIDNGRIFDVDDPYPTYLCDPNERLIVSSGGTSRQDADQGVTRSRSAGTYSWQCRGFEVILKKKKSGGKNSGSRDSDIQIAPQSGSTATCGARITAECGVGSATAGSCKVGVVTGFSPGGCDSEGGCWPATWTCNNTGWASTASCSY